MQTRSVKAELLYALGIVSEQLLEGNRLLELVEVLLQRLSL